MDFGVRARPKALRTWPRLADRAVLYFEKLVDRHRYRAWYERADLTADWTSGNLPRWRQMLGVWRDRPLRILEIGTFEGRASIFFLNFFPRSTFVGIDLFDGDFGATAAARLEHNMAPYGDRVEVLKMDAVAALEQLGSAQRQFDLIYIDVSHYYDIAKAATRAAWPLTVPGSVVIWDDYTWDDVPPEQRGATAIDEFLRERDGSYRVLGRGYQLAVERLR